MRSTALPLSASSAGSFADEPGVSSAVSLAASFAADGANAVPLAGVRSPSRSAENRSAENPDGG